MKPAPACPSCGSVHTLGEICPERVAVAVTVRPGQGMSVKQVRPRKTARRVSYKSLLRLVLWAWLAAPTGAKEEA
jgi:hypothetical protein